MAKIENSDKNEINLLLDFAAINLVATNSDILNDIILSSKVGAWGRSRTGTEYYSEGF